MRRLNLKINLPYFYTVIIMYPLIQELRPILTKSYENYRVKDAIKI